MSPNDEVRARLQGVAKMIERELPGAPGFALLIFTEDPDDRRCEYVSNRQRGDVCEAMREWLDTAGTPYNFGRHIE